jgi:hypothetical protein
MIFCRKIYGFLVAKPIHEMCKAALTLFYGRKKLLPVVNIKNGGSIQDGVEYFFSFIFFERR